MTIPPVEIAEPNTGLPLYNRPIDVPTFLVDNVSSMVADATVIKIGFTEVLPTLGGGQQARFVVNLAMARSQAKQLVSTLSSLLQDMERHEAGQSRA